MGKMGLKRGSANTCEILLGTRMQNLKSMNQMYPEFSSLKKSRVLRKTRFNFSGLNCRAI